MTVAFQPPPPHNSAETARCRQLARQDEVPLSRLTGEPTVLPPPGPLRSLLAPLLRFPAGPRSDREEHGSHSSPVPLSKFGTQESCRGPASPQRSPSPC